MRSFMLVTAIVAVAVTACSRTKEGDVVVDRPGEVEVHMKKDTLNVPSVGTKTDSVNTPVIGTQKETVIVNKPVIGSKKTQIKQPTIHR